MTAPTGAPPAAPRVLAPKVYDALQASAERHGGIGAFGTIRDTAPLCAYALLADAEGNTDDLIDRTYALANARALPVTMGESDRAVAAVRYRQGPYEVTDRISFADWCHALGVVRGAP